MNTNRDLNYRLFIQKENDFTRTDIHSEFEKYYAIRDGDISRVKENYAKARLDFNKGKGQLSDDPLRNNIYHLVVCAAIVARICVDGGLEHNVAYTLSDIYIRKADKCTDPDEVLDLLGDMQVDFAQRMRETQKTGAVSVHVRRTIDYIYDHLHEPLTLEMLAERETASKLHVTAFRQGDGGYSEGLYYPRKDQDRREYAQILLFSAFGYISVFGFLISKRFYIHFPKDHGDDSRTVPQYVLLG